MIAAAPMTVHSTPPLPRKVTALTTATNVVSPAIRLLMSAAAPWSAESSGAHCTRTRMSKSAKTIAATVTTISGARLRRWRSRVPVGTGGNCPPGQGSHIAVSGQTAGRMSGMSRRPRRPWREVLEGHPTRGDIMKYMILLYGSQQDYDALSGKASADRPAWSAEDFAAMGAFMESFTKDLTESGELVDTKGLTAPLHARRIQLRGGVPVVTDGPYAETQEVLAGYWVVECESFDRATEIAGRLAGCPGPAGAA